MEPISLPFGRGETYHGPSATISTDYDSTSLGIEGMRVYFKDKTVQTATTLETNRSGDYVEARCVRNVSGITLKARRAVRYKTDKVNQRVDGYTSSYCQAIDGIVDPALAYGNANGGVRNNDLFWLIVEGAVEGVTGSAGDATNVISLGNRLVALSGTSSLNDDAGRLCAAPTTFTATQTTDGTAANVAINHVGRAMSSKATSDTSAAILTTFKAAR